MPGTDHPGCAVFISCQCLKSRALAPQPGEQGEFKLGTGENLLLWLAAPPLTPPGGQDAQQLPTSCWGHDIVCQRLGHGSSCQVTESSPTAQCSP